YAVAAITTSAAPSFFAASATAAPCVSASACSNPASTAWTGIPYAASSCADCCAPAPTTMPCTCPPLFDASCCAAVSALSVAFFKCPWACSATRRMVAISDHLRFVVELLDQRQDVRDLDARRARGRRFDLDHLHLGRDVDAEPRRVQLLDGLLLGFHDVGQARVARDVEPQVDGD